MQVLLPSILLAFAVDPSHAATMARSQEIFTKHVRPLFLEQCVKCHGGEKVRGGFDLTSREGLLKGGDHGLTVLAGKGKDSRLVKMIAHLDETIMPPKSPKMPDSAIAFVSNWIDLGADYDKPLIEKTSAVKKPMVVTAEDRRFWSFQDLKRPALPKVSNGAWCRKAIDHFILAKLEEKKLQPNGSAEKYKLVRRAFFDTIGLPPTPEQVEMLTKNNAPRAYEDMIDRLLDNPHFGERWARHWLDLARFAESHGFEHDYDRLTAYHYRDFVIKAINQNVPYDTFVKWQIAGDELEPNNPLALAATGFLGAGVHSTQITANQVEKERYDELDDIVSTIGTSMLGLTVGCARCHDHKYDPVPTKDYYRLLSTFTTTVRTEVDVDPVAGAVAKKKFDAEQEKLAAALKAYEAGPLTKRLDDWLATRGSSAKSVEWFVLDITGYHSKGGATFTKLPDGSVLVAGKNPNHDVVTFDAQTSLKGITGIRLEALAHSSLVLGGPGRAGNGNFALTDFQVMARPSLRAAHVVVNLTNPTATFEQIGFPVRAAIDGDKGSAWAVDPQFGKDHAAVFETVADIGRDGSTDLNFQLHFNNNTGHGIGRPRLSVSTSPRPLSADKTPLPPPVSAILKILDADPKAKLASPQREVLMKWFRERDAEWQRLSKAAADHQKAGVQMPKMLICSEGLPAMRLHSQGADFLNETHFLKRGDPNQKDGIAPQGFPQVLMRNPDGEKRWLAAPPAGSKLSYRRRALAAWITDVDQGAGHLLARVMVNRIWQHYFGRGLVATPSDFGLQGERPTHPELLDWLARELVDNGWNLKHIHKLILMSATYQESSSANGASQSVDPDNKLYWRHPPRRLEAEIVRDNFLAVSGLLDRQQFGPGTLDVNHKRRSIYFFVKRSQLIPSMILFDAPDALQGAERRQTTTIAPQALMVMNNQLVRSCAENFARRVDKPGQPLEKSLHEAYLVALGRSPASTELADSAAFVKEQEASYKAVGNNDARHLAFTDFCQVLMGLNEFIYVD